MKKRAVKNEPGTPRTNRGVKPVEKKVSFAKTEFSGKFAAICGYELIVNDFLIVRYVETRRQIVTVVLLMVNTLRSSSDVLR